MERTLMTKALISTDQPAERVKSSIHKKVTISLRIAIIDYKVITEKSLLLSFQGKGTTYHLRHTKYAASEEFI
jgi:hypothetical protein